MSSLTIKEVFSNCLSLLSFIFPDVYPIAIDLPASPIIKVSSLGVEEYTVELVYAAPTLKLKVKVNDKKLTYTLLDTSTKVNIIISKLAREARLIVHPYLHITLIAYRGEYWWFDRVCEDIEISIGGVHSINLIFVVSKVDQ